MTRSGTQLTFGAIVGGTALFCRLLAIVCPLAFIAVDYMYDIYGARGPLWLRAIFELPSGLYGATLAVALSVRRKFNVATLLQVLIVALVMGVPSIGNVWDPIMAFFASVCAGGVAANSLPLTGFANRPYVRFAVRAGYRIIRALVAGALCCVALLMPWAQAGGGEQFITGDFTAFAGVTYVVVFGVLAFDLVVDLCVRAAERKSRTPSTLS